MRSGLGEQMHAFARELWPLNRSITGDGVRETLRMIEQHLPGLEIFEVPTGTAAFDWTVPPEWRVHEAWIETPTGQRICDFRENNLHLVGYSVAADAIMPLTELQERLHSLPDQPHAIPYVTSYYSERWGFCLTQQQRDALPDGDYRVHIDAELFQGSMTYGELILPGQRREEVFLSTYVCHPSMADNELSGPVVTTFLAKWLAERQRRFTYRIVFIPETIGSITYLSRNLAHLQSRVVAGFNISCVGDDRAYSFLPSRRGTTLSDRVARHVLGRIDPAFTIYPWSDRGSDERQYCSPLVDLPIASIMRSKYGTYAEYHTSLDDLERVVTPEGLSGGYEALRQALLTIEQNRTYLATTPCEPQLGKRGLYPTLSAKGSAQHVRAMMEVLTWADGEHSLLDVAELSGEQMSDLAACADTLLQAGLLTAAD